MLSMAAVNLLVLAHVMRSKLVLTMVALHLFARLRMLPPLQDSGLNHSAITAVQMWLGH